MGNCGSPWCQDRMKESILLVENNEDQVTPHENQMNRSASHIQSRGLQEFNQSKNSRPLSIEKKSKTPTKVKETPDEPPKAK